MMNSDSSGDSPSANFAFAFDNSIFSDKLLRIVILNDDEANSEIPPSPKRPRIELHGDAEADNSSLNDLTATEVKTLHISSLVFAAMSPYFLKLFSNGMMESKQQHVTLRINDNEEAALMELLNFMYNKTPSVTTAREWLDILIAADKYEVVSCMKYCCRVLLNNMEMTIESALMYLELPSSILSSEAIQPLRDAARKFLIVNFCRSKKELVKLCREEFEAVLSSDNLRVATEDAVYDTVLNWARHNYPSLTVRQDIIGTHLIHLIRFPYMTFSKLKNVLSNEDLDHKKSSNAVLEAFLFKSGALHQQGTFVAQVSNSHRFVERDYIYRPLKVVEFDSPTRQCVLYLDLKREECAKLYPSGRLRSQPFYLGQHSFTLSVVHSHSPSLHSTGLYLGLDTLGPVRCHTIFKYAARTKPRNEYVLQAEGEGVFTPTSPFGQAHRDLFYMPWTDFIAENSFYFIDDILHLRAEVTIKE